MFIAIIVDAKLLEAKRKEESSQQAQNLESNNNTGNANDLGIDMMGIDVEKAFSPLTILERALETYDNKIEFLAADPDVLTFLRVGNFDLIINTTGKSSTQFHPAQFTGLFTISEIPFIGSGMDAINLCKNKILFKSLLKLNKIATPRFLKLQIQYGKFPKLKNNLNYPIVVKIFKESIHSQKNPDQIASNAEELGDILGRLAKKVKFADIILEEFIPGKIFYLPILGNDLTSNVRFLPMAQYKYRADLSGADLIGKKRPEPDIMFLDITDPIVKRARKILHSAYSLYNCRDYAMGVFFLNETTNNLLLHELNPITSLLPGGKLANAAENIGISYVELINDIVLNAMKRYGLKIRGKYAKRLKELEL
ncbi:MAG: hypothetical protein ACTSWL_10480 [Promethearchaeota archaeon]